MVQEEQEDSPPTELKNREIPILSYYDNGASNEFWSAFPKNYNSKLQKTVKIKLLKKLIQKCWFSWTFSQRRTRLQGRDPIQLKKSLNSVKVKNTPSAIAKGPFITDAVASWIKKGYVQGFGSALI